MSNEDSPQNDWWKTFMKRHPVPQESLEHFRSIEWTNAYLQDPAYRPVSSFSRTTKPNGEDFFFAETVNTEKTIPHYVCLQLQKFETSSVTKAAPQQMIATGKKVIAIAPDQPDCIFLLRIGARGLDGHPETLHGGMACAILDETMGFNAVLHNYNLDGPKRKHNLYTANLNTTYRAPLATPGEIIVRTWLEKREGRKWTLHGQIMDKNGIICTDAEGLWVQVPATKL